MARTKKWVKRVGWIVEKRIYPTKNKWRPCYWGVGSNREIAIRHFMHVPSRPDYDQLKKENRARTVPLYVEVPDGEE